MNKKRTGTKQPLTRRMKMNCPRCSGMMVSEWVPGISDEVEENPYGMWRCVSCGEILDPLIVVNRKKSQIQPVN
jgi:uncharacterized Zn finger protein